MDHNSIEYHWIFSKAHSKATGTRPPFCFFFLYMFILVCMQLCVNVCECREGSVCGISKYCGIPNYATSIYLASQGCNKRIEWDDGKEGWLGVGTRWVGGARCRVEGGGYRGTDGSSGSGLFWANSWKQTHITNMLLCSRICFALITIFSFWLKCTGSEDSVSQPGLSKQVRDHQHSSEVFSFLFTEEIYIGHVKNKSTEARAGVTIQKNTK